MTKEAVFQVHISNKNASCQVGVAVMVQGCETNCLEELVWSPGSASCSPAASVGLVQDTVSSYVDSLKTKCDII